VAFFIVVAMKLKSVRCRNWS